MPYVSTLIDRVYFIRWLRASLVDVDAVLNELREARAQLGPPVFGVAILPPDHEPPSDEVRKVMGSRMGPLLDTAECIYFVIEGTGFRHSIARSVLSTLMLLGGRRGQVIVHSSVEDAVFELAPRLSLQPKTLIDVARARGVIAAYPSVDVGAKRPRS